MYLYRTSADDTLQKYNIVIKRYMNFSDDQTIIIILVLYFRFMCTRMRSSTCRFNPPRIADRSGRMPDAQDGPGRRVCDGYRRAIFFVQQSEKCFFVGLQRTNPISLTMKSLATKRLAISPGSDGVVTGRNHHVACSEFHGRRLVRRINQAGSLSSFD